MGWEFVFIVHGVISPSDVDFPLHGFIMLLLRDVTSISRMAFAGMHSVHAALLTLLCSRLAKGFSR